MTENIRKLIHIPASKYKLRAKVGFSWFLSDEDKKEFYLICQMLTVSLFPLHLRR